MLTAYPNLFSQAKIGRQTLKNHIVMSPMDTNFAAPDGTVTDQMIAYYTKRAAGGVAGMQAALTAAERGHQVTLIEKESRLGGRINLACVPPDKEILETVVPWFEYRLKEEGVKVILGADAAAEIEKIKPEKIILATGSLPFVPPIPGKERAVESWQVLSGEVPMPAGKKVVVIGGGNVGCETALHLIEKGNNQISIIEMLPVLSGGQESSHRSRDMAMLKAANANLQVNAKVREITEHSVFYENAEGAIVEEPADLVVVGLTFMKNCAIMDTMW